MKHSLRVKNTVILTALLVLLIGLCWLLNRFFLDDYYLNKKINYLSESFYNVNNLGSLSSSDNSAFNSGVEKTEASYNVSIYIIYERQDVFGTAWLTYVYPVTMDFGENGYSSIFRNDRFKRITDSLKKYIFSPIDSGKSDSPDLLYSSDRFGVYKLYDPEIDSQFIDLVGYLDNGYLIFIRSNYENIAESAEISSRFMAIVGISVIVLGIFLMLMITKSFTKPILELADISDKMAGLDFNSRYKGKRKDEIGKLGNSINTLSDRLENTITDLKTANIELERDIANKIEIDELRKEFLSNVSHELKTPIALIQGYAEGLQDNINDNDSESRNFYCEVIIDEAQKMNSMVKKLLTLNEIEFGSNKLELEHFDIIELVRSVTQSIDILARSKDIRVIFNEHKPVPVWADVNMIEEVITNYLNNALNHCDGKKIIDISFKEYPENKIRVSVFNTGDNIPEDELDNIWVKFYKIDKARTREYGGSGIGLSIVKAIMDQHNEAFGVKNHIAGVEFWFELDMKADK